MSRSRSICGCTHIISDALLHPASDGKTFLDHAIARGFNDFADTLRDYGAMTSAELTPASER